MGDVRCGRRVRGTFFPFLIQDKTPREQRAFPQGKPMTKEFRGVTRVVIAVRNLDDAIERYRQAYGAPPPIKQVDKVSEATWRCWAICRWCWRNL